MPFQSLSEWEHFIANFPGVHILQTGAWGELKSIFGWQAVRIVTEAGPSGNGGRVGVQLLLRRLPLGFSVAYHIEPDVILLDEVLGVGDESFRNKSTAAMKEQIKSDKTVVLVSHNMPLLREVCDRLVWIEDGETRAQGNVPDVIKTYLDSISQGRNKTSDQHSET